LNTKGQSGRVTKTITVYFEKAGEATAKDAKHANGSGAQTTRGAGAPPAKDGQDARPSLTRNDGRDAHPPSTKNDGRDAHPPSTKNDGRDAHPPSAHGQDARATESIRFAFTGEIRVRYKAEPMASFQFGRAKANAVETRTVTITNQMDSPLELRNARVDEGVSPQYRTRSASERLNDGTRSASERPNDGTRSASERLNDGTRSASERPNDGTRSASERPNDGTRSASERPNDGTRSASERLNDGTRSASERLNDGTRSASERPNDGTRSASERLNDGTRSASERPNDGTRSASERPADNAQPFFVDLREIEKGKRYEVAVATVPPLAEGQIRGKVILDTNLKELATIELPISGFVVPRLGLTPAFI
jgi:hypothetical protein